MSWVVLTCQEGLIYDKNLRSCAIPPEDWDCNFSSEEVDDSGNVYGIDNLETRDNYREDSDEFLEVIDGDKDLEALEGREDATELSGDGSLEENHVTQSSLTEKMITVQVQRLTQLLKNIPKNNNNQITADDLNTYLDTQKIQAKSPEYQQNIFDAFEKTTVPADGMVHPEIQTEIINRQNDMNYRLTTLSMDATTPSTSIKPIFFVDKEPVTEIKLNSGMDGLTSHQIVVNRPEGSVMFNVPAKTDNKQNSPYFSEELLKTILELSKQMVMQKTASNAENTHHPLVLALPIPIISPQGNIQNYYGQFSNQTVSTTQKPQIRFPVKPPRKKVNKNRINSYENIYKQENNDYDSLKNTHQINNRYPQNNQQGNYPNYDYSNYYNPYSTYNQFYNPMSYYQYSNTGNDRYSPAQNQFSNYNAAYYGNRPFVSDSSAPFVDHQSPHRRKESFSSSYEHDDYDALRDESDATEEDFSSDEEDRPSSPTDGLICTNAIARQANKTDCFKYYVCNAKTKEVLSYTCPAFTAFNDQTKFCDSSMFKTCKKSQDGSFKNNKLYAEAHKALQQAKRESQKVERIANLVKKQSQRIINNRNQAPIEYEEEEYVPPPKFVRRPVPAQRRKTVKNRTKSASVHNMSNIKRRRKNKVRCITPGNIPDPEDSFSYWHCFKSSDGKYKRIHKRCTSNLRFCEESLFCSPQC